MSIYESVLLFIISAVPLLAAAAIHGFVLVMIRLDRRRDKRRQSAGGGENQFTGFVKNELNGSGR